MNINLYENYWLKSDPLNYTLIEKRKVVDKKSKNFGGEYEDVCGYFTTIEGAIRHMCTREIRACKCTTIKGLVKEVQALQDVVAALADEIGADNLVKGVLKMHREGSPLLTKGDSDEPKKRGRKKKTE